MTDPLIIDVWLDRATSADNTARSTGIRTGHADVLFRFPSSMPPAEKARICAQIAATWRQREIEFAAADAAMVPAQRSAS